MANMTWFTILCTRTFGSGQVQEDLLRDSDKGTEVLSQYKVPIGMLWAGVPSAVTYKVGQSF